MRYNTVIFDLDGTLLDTLDDLTDSLNHVMEVYEIDTYERDEVRQFVGNGIKRLMEQAVPDGMKHPQFEDIFDAFIEYYGEHCNDKTKPYDGIIPLLDALKSRGISMAIVSNKADAAVKVLNEIYFKDYISVAIGEKESQGIKKKPAPDTVNEALRLLGKSNEDALYIGDSDVDILTAKNSNMPIVSCTWGFRDETFLRNHDATILIEKPEDLLEFI